MRFIVADDVGKDGSIDSTLLNRTYIFGYWGGECSVN